MSDAMLSPVKITGYDDTTASLSSLLKVSKRLSIPSGNDMASPLRSKSIFAVGCKSSNTLFMALLFPFWLDDNVESTVFRRNILNQS